jgi:hypothetical protein
LRYHGISLLDDQDDNDGIDAETESEQHTSSTLLSAVNSKQVNPDAKDREVHTMKRTEPMTCKRDSYNVTFYTNTLNRDTT